MDALKNTSEKLNDSGERIVEEGCNSQPNVPQVLPVADINLLTAALFQSILASELSKNAWELFQASTQPAPSDINPLDLRTITLPFTPNSMNKPNLNEIKGLDLRLLSFPFMLNSTNAPIKNETHIEDSQTPIKQFRSILPKTDEHEMERPVDLLNYSTEHRCPYTGCDKTFRFNHALVNHYRIHTGEKPHACDYPGCKAAFARHSNLVTHRMIHLNRSMRKTFDCPVPGCDKNFLKKANLDDHMNIHLNKRPYACDYPNCGKAFRCRSNLSGHRRVHARMEAKKRANKISSLEENINASSGETEICGDHQDDGEAI
nr:zinc finger protein [Hymenolepis microstoma]